MIVNMSRRGHNVRLRIFILIIVCLFLAAGAAALEEVELPGPAWMTPAIAAAIGVLSSVAYWRTESTLSVVADQEMRQRERVFSQVAAIESLVGADGNLPRVRDVDGTLLGIHPAIPLPPNSDPGLPAELPVYVPRDVDSDLRAALQQAREAGGFVLLVGASASGKTRCAFEGVKAVLGDWRLCHPGRPELLTALVESGADMGQTVVWLDDAQNILRSGELSVATVRRLLMDRTRPVVLVGTIWQEEYGQLTKENTTGDSQGPGWDAREILKLARRFSIRSFSQSEQDRAREIAQVDPRIKEAVVNDGDAARLAEMLAAVPDLIHKMEQADPYGAAIVNAAVDARLCGHPEPLPNSLLETLADYNLAGPERAEAQDDWYASAVGWARERVRGSVRLLTPHGTQVGHIDGYCVTDVLVQHAQRTRLPTATPSHAQWERLIALATPEACLHIGYTAYLAELDSLAERSWERGAEAGNTNAMAALGSLLFEQKRDSEARPWVERAVESGNVQAVRTLGSLLLIENRHEQARPWLERAAEAGDANAMMALGSLLFEQRKDDEARQWVERSVEAGDTDAMATLAMLLLREDKHEEARPWLRRAAEAGNLDAMAVLGDELVLEHDYKTGCSWLERAAKAGNERAMSALMRLPIETEECEEPRLWIKRASEGGDEKAMCHYGEWLLAEGNHTEGYAWLERAARAGNNRAMLAVGLRLLESDERDRARPLLERAAEAGNVHAMQFLGIELIRDGNQEEALPWLKRSAEAGNCRAMAILGRTLLAENEPGEAKPWLELAAQANDITAMSALGILLITHGEIREGASWLEHAAESGNAEAMNLMGIFLLKEGEKEAARSWLERAEKAKNTAVVDFLGEMETALRSRRS
ncbi:tetratricopeptide repeat protein [Streptomyces sp. NPDC127077]|uniref:tetratricopeptide repeat protein n=1 Tax=Streptomyces sp. NPDC127077 TaxID=3347131 RepID=UPI0036648C11